MKEEKDDASEVETRARAFLKSRKTLQLATVGLKVIPTASYAPFVRREGCFYVYLSALSLHTKDMNEFSAVSALLIEDERDARNIFARKRITFSCDSSIIPRETKKWCGIMDRFEQKFGEVFSMIRPLGDFTLFRLEPYEVVYVEGFGKAFHMDPNLVNPVHVKGTGPGAKKMT